MIDETNTFSWRKWSLLTLFYVACLAVQFCWTPSPWGILFCSLWLGLHLAEITPAAFVERDIVRLKDMRIALLTQQRDTLMGLTGLSAYQYAIPLDFSGVPPEVQEWFLKHVQRPVVNRPTTPEGAA